MLRDMCVLNHCLEWDKWVLNERTYPTPDSGLTHLFSRLRVVVAYNTVLVWSRLNGRLELSTRYHSRHNGRDIGSTSATVE